MTLVALTTPDQPAAARLCAQAATETGAACVGWDSLRGPHALNETATDTVSAICQAAGGMAPTDLVSWPDYALVLDFAAAQLGPAMLVVYNVHRLVGSDEVKATQGIMNLRDSLGSNGVAQTLVMLCPSWPGSVELGSDVMLIDDPLPGDEERATSARQIIDGAVDQGASIGDVDTAIEAAVKATRGLSRYAAEQTVSIALERDGLDKAQLQRRFVDAINVTPGLTYSPEVIAQEDIGGLSNFKEFARIFRGGRAKVGAVIIVDEIEKALGGSTGQSADSSGTSQAILGMLLSWMEDQRARGLIALGPPGSGKSMSAKALGALINAPTIKLDVGEFKDSLVGQSEANCRAALKTLESLAGGETFWVATCNSEASLPPELMARFGSGLWFFDLPDAEERDTIWKIYLGKNDFAPNTPRPNDEGWTGREIRGCVENAWALNTDPVTAAQWIVPAAKSKAETIKALRQSASGRCVSASQPGAYQYTEIVAKAPVAGRRAMSF